MCVCMCLRVCVCVCVCVTHVRANTLKNIFNIRSIYMNYGFLHRLRSKQYVFYQKYVNTQRSRHVIINLDDLVLMASWPALSTD